MAGVNKALWGALRLSLTNQILSIYKLLTDFCVKNIVLNV